MRRANILNRSLFEYNLRLRIYPTYLIEALRDAAEAPKELRKLFESKPVEAVSYSNISAEDLKQFEKFLEENKGKPRYRNVWDDLMLMLLS